MSQLNEDGIITKPNDMEELILDATMRVVSRETIGGTRMLLIADEAGIPKSNLHYYFKTKRNLLVALHHRSITRLINRRKSMRTECQESLKDQLRIFFDQKLQSILKEPEFDFMEIDFWVQANIEPEFKKNLIDSFRIWRQEILDVILNCRPDLSEKKQQMIPYVLLSLMEGATMQYHLDSKTFDIQGYMNYCVDLICAELERS